MKPGFYLAAISGDRLVFRTKGGQDWTPAEMWYQTKPLKTRPTNLALAGAFWGYVPSPNTERLPDARRSGRARCSA